ncbi:MAG: hypothetical protein VX690_05930 [Pseudomonadota bacterium]|jgi:hypothetical protein|nr:hypothetical protein [Pseudomonadota bacterium]
MRRIGILILIAGVVSGCSSNEVIVAHSVELVPETATVPEEELLDVSIVVFDSGVPEGEIDHELLEELINDGTFVQIRRTEARYMAVHLRDTLQKSGHWGGVWVTPEESTAADINITAEIRQSDGDRVRLDVIATDATGRIWLDDEYGMETAAGSYNRQRYPDLDPYQDVFNNIANDLAAVRGDLSSTEARNIRSVSQIRFAGELSPEAFGDYVEQRRNGAYELRRLPAEDDPQFERTLRVREREHLFIETLNEHYVDFYQNSQDSYDGWREFAREEALAIRELQRSANWRTGLGIAGVVASVLYGSSGGNNSYSQRVLRDSIMYMSMDMIRTGALRRQERRLHTASLEELSSSFDEEVRPMVVDIEGVQHRLTGTADAQYEEWRELLLQLYQSETGLVPEVDIYTEALSEVPSEEETELLEESSKAKESADSDGEVTTGV